MQAVSSRTRPAAATPELRPEAVVVELGERARRELSTPGAGTCSCGEEVWRFRTSGNPSLVRFDDYPGGDWYEGDVDGEAVARPIRRGSGNLRLHVCGRRHDEDPLP